MGMLKVVMLAMMGRMEVLGMETKMQMDPGFWSLQIGLNLVICNTLFMKQVSQMVTYASGPVNSTVDYIIVLRKEDNDWVKKYIEYEMQGARPKVDQRKLGQRLWKKTVRHVD